MPFLIIKRNLPPHEEVSDGSVRPPATLDPNEITHSVELDITDEALAFLKSEIDTIVNVGQFSRLSDHAKVVRRQHNEPRLQRLQAQRAFIHALGWEIAKAEKVLHDADHEEQEARDKRLIADHDRLQDSLTYNFSKHL